MICRQDFPVTSTNALSPCRAVSGSFPSFGGSQSKSLPGVRRQALLPFRKGGAVFRLEQTSPHVSHHAIDAGPIPRTVSLTVFRRSSFRPSEESPQIRVFMDRMDRLKGSQPAGPGCSAPNRGRMARSRHLVVSPPIGYQEQPRAPGLNQSVSLNGSTLLTYTNRWTGQTLESRMARH